MEGGMMKGGAAVPAATVAGERSDIIAAERDVITVEGLWLAQIYLFALLEETRMEGNEETMKEGGKEISWTGGCFLAVAILCLKYFTYMFVKLKPPPLTTIPTQNWDFRGHGDLCGYKHLRGHGVFVVPCGLRGSQGLLGLGVFMGSWVFFALDGILFFYWQFYINTYKKNIGEMIFRHKMATTEPQFHFCAFVKKPIVLMFFL